MAQGDWLFTVVANKLAWQYASNVQIGEGEIAILKASGSWGVIDPAHRGNCGPQGNGVTGTNEIIAPGKPEGCLLCKTANGEVFAFPESCMLTTSIPGYLYFIANDYVDTGNGSGFGDNTGTLLVEIVIQQAHVGLKASEINVVKGEPVEITHVLQVR